MKNLRRNNSGFTLIELIVVMIIIGILVLLATPRFLNYVKDARVTALQVDSKVLMDGALLANIDKNADGQAIDGNYPVTDDTVEFGDNVEDAIIKTTGVIGEEVSDISKLGLKRLDEKEMDKHIRNTKYAMGDFAIATKGDLAGEVFYTHAVMENGRGDAYVHMISADSAK